MSQEKQPAPVPAKEVNAKTNRYRTVALATFFAGVVTSLLVWHFSREQLIKTEQVRLNHHADQVRAALAERLKTQSLALRGMRALFDASEHIDRDDWHRYVKQLNPTALQGALGSAFVRYVNRENLGQFIAATRGDNAPEFLVKTSGEHPDLYVVEYIEPLEPNHDALGFDLGQEPIRRQALVASVAHNREVLSGRITLAQQKEEHSGFLLVLPVFHKGFPLDTVEQRWQALQGWVGMPILLDELLGGLAEDPHVPVKLETFDGEGDQRQALTCCPDTRLKTPTDGISLLPKHQHQTQAILDVGGRRWVLDFATLPGFTPLLEHNFPALLLISGLLMSTLASRQIAVYGQSLYAAKNLVQLRTDELHNSEERYRLLYTETPAMLHSIDRDGRLISVSNQWLMRLGYQRADVLGRRSTEFMTESSRQYALDTVLPAFFVSGQCQDIHYQMISKNGEIVDVLLSAIAVRDETGTIVDSMASLIDITAQRQAEKILRETSELLETVFLNAPFIIMILDSQARVLKTNLPNHFDAAGNDNPEERVHRLCGQILGCLNHEGDHRACGDGEACEDCPIREGLGQTLNSLTCPDDQEIEMQLMVEGRPTTKIFILSVRSLTFYQGEAVLVTLSDISELKIAERQHLAWERQLLHTQKLESLGILAGSVAHDFNNLLMVILGHLDLAQTHVAAGSPLLPNLTVAKQSAHHAAQLTRQLLAFAGRDSARSIPVDLAKVVVDNAELLKISIGKRIDLHTEIANGLPPIAGDPGHLQQVIMNLIINASEAIGENPGVIRLSLNDEQYTAEALQGNILQPPPPPGRYLALNVVDNGCGMDQTTQKRIFDPFFTTKQSGRGLGMSSLLGIVKNMQGAVFINSLPGQGTTLRLLFPVSEAGTEQTQEELASASESLDFGFKGRLLIIDDEESIRFVCSEYAQMFGFQVLTAANGEEGVRIFCQHADTIDCVLVDLNMPGMNGLETFDKIRQQQPRIRGILTSAYSEGYVLENLTGSNLMAFIQKPYEIKDLRRKIAEVFKTSDGENC